MAAGLPANLVVKCRLDWHSGRETRIFELLRPSLSELRCKLCWLFNLQDSFELKYLDKSGELVTFSTDEELGLALKEQKRPELQVIVATRAHVPAVNGRQEEESHKIVDQPAAVEDQKSVVSSGCEPEATSSRDWYDLFHPEYLRPRTCWRSSGRQPGKAVQTALAGYSVADEAAGGKFVHFGLSCVACGASPLIGWRFKCSVCPDYNVCSRCFSAYSHPHGFFRLP